MKSSRFNLSVCLSLGLILSSYGLSCGGSGGGGSDDSSGGSSDINLTGTIAVPVAASESLSATRGVKRQTTTDQGAANVTCNCLTMAGEALGEFTTASDGTFTLPVDPETLLSDDGSANDCVVIECENGISSLACPPDGTTESYDSGTTNVASTIGLAELASEIPNFGGWQEGEDVTDNFTVEPACAFLMYESMYENSDTSGEGLNDETGIIPEAMANFIVNNGKPEDVGKGSLLDVAISMVKGTAEEEGVWDQVSAVADPSNSFGFADNYDSSVEVINEVGSFFQTNFGSEGLGNAAIPVTANLTKQEGEEETTEDTEVNLCECMKSGECDPAAFTGPILAADDLTAFGEVFKSSAGPTVFFNFLASTVSGGTMGSIKDTPSVLWGMLNKEAAGGFSNMYDPSSGIIANAMGVMGAAMSGGGCQADTPEAQKSCGGGLWGTVQSGGIDSFLDSNGAVKLDAIKPLCQYFINEIKQGGGNIDFGKADSTVFADAFNDVYKPILSNPTGFTDCFTTNTCPTTLPGAGTFTGATDFCTTCSSQTGSSSCGNSICEGSENSTSCIEDCSSVVAIGPTTSVCGDNICSGTETGTSCPGDCGGFSNTTTGGSSTGSTTGTTTGSTTGGSTGTTGGSSTSNFSGMWSYSCSGSCLSGMPTTQSFSGTNPTYNNGLTGSNLLTFTVSSSSSACSFLTGTAPQQSQCSSCTHSGSGTVGSTVTASCSGGTINLNKTAN